MGRYTILVVGLLAILPGCNATATHSESKALAKTRFDQQKANMKYLLALEKFDYGQIDQAKQSVQEAIGLYPDSPEYYLLLAKIYIEQGALARAKKALRYIAFEAQPQAPYFYVAGLLSERYGNIEEACEHYKRATELDQLEIMHLLAYAELLAHVERHDEALKLINEHLKDFDGDARLYALSGEILQLTNRHGEAAIAFTRALALYPEDDMLREAQAMSLFRSGEYARAIPALRELCDIKSRDAPSHVLHALARCYMEVGQLQTAETCLRTIIRSNPEDGLAWLGLARCRIAMQDYPQALKSARRAVQLGLRNTAARLTLGYIYVQQENWIAARETLESAVRQDPAAPLWQAPLRRDALCLLGHIEDETGQALRAIEYYRQAMEMDPLDVSAGQLFEFASRAYMEDMEISIDLSPAGR